MITTETAEELQPEGGSIDLVSLDIIKEEDNDVNKMASGSGVSSRSGFVFVSKPAVCCSFVIITVFVGVNVLSRRQKRDLNFMPWTGW